MSGSYGDQKVTVMSHGEVQAKIKAMDNGGKGDKFAQKKLKEASSDHEVNQKTGIGEGKYD